MTPQELLFYYDLTQTLPDMSYMKNIKQPEKDYLLDILVLSKDKLILHGYKSIPRSFALRFAQPVLGCMDTLQLLKAITPYISSPYRQLDFDMLYRLYEARIKDDSC